MNIDACLMSTHLFFFGFFFSQRTTPGSEAQIWAETPFKIPFYVHIWGPWDLTAPGINIARAHVLLPWLAIRERHVPYSLTWMRSYWKKKKKGSLQGAANASHAQ